MGLGAKSSKKIFLSPHARKCAEALFAATKRVSSCRLRDVVKSQKFKDYVAKVNSVDRKLAADSAKNTNEKFVFKPVETPLTVSFTNLNLFLKNNHDIRLLENIFGVLHPYTITAVLI